MTDFLESIREFLAELLSGNGNSQRSLKALNRMEDKLDSAKRDNEDSLNSLKEEIKNLERRAVQKKHELDQVGGDSKRIVVGEIERIFRELDRLHGRENVASANLDRIGIAIAKIGEAKVALQAGISEEQFDDIALEIQSLFGRLGVLDRAAGELDRERYDQPKPSDVKIDKRIAEIQGYDKTSVKLSAETEKKLRQLEGE